MILGCIVYWLCGVRRALQRQTSAVVIDGLALFLEGLDRLEDVLRPA
jgi:hypothetical protein